VYMYVFLLVRSGLLVGATTIGTLATYAGQDLTMESSYMCTPIER